MRLSPVLVHVRMNVRAPVPARVMAAVLSKLTVADATLPEASIPPVVTALRVNRRLVVEAVAPEYRSVPPPKTRSPALGLRLPWPMLLGLPALARSMVSSTPAVTVVTPLYVLPVLFSLQVPAPILVTASNWTLTVGSLNKGDITLVPVLVPPRASVRAPPPMKPIAPVLVQLMVLAAAVPLASMTAPLLASP